MLALVGSAATPASLPALGPLLSGAGPMSVQLVGLSGIEVEGRVRSSRRSQASRGRSGGFCLFAFFKKRPRQRGSWSLVKALLLERCDLQRTNREVSAGRGSSGRRRTPNHFYRRTGSVPPERS